MSLRTTIAILAIILKDTAMQYNKFDTCTLHVHALHSHGLNTGRHLNVHQCTLKYIPVKWLHLLTSKSLLSKSGNVKQCRREGLYGKCQWRGQVKIKFLKCRNTSFKIFLHFSTGGRAVKIFHTRILLKLNGLEDRVWLCMICRSLQVGQWKLQVWQLHLHTVTQLHSLHRKLQVWSTVIHTVDFEADSVDIILGGGSGISAWFLHDFRFPELGSELYLIQSPATHLTNFK